MLTFLRELHLYSIKSKIFIASKICIFFNELCCSPFFSHRNQRANCGKYFFSLISIKRAVLQGHKYCVYLVYRVYYRAGSLHLCILFKELKTWSFYNERFSRLNGEKSREIQINAKQLKKITCP